MHADDGQRTIQNDASTRDLARLPFPLPPLAEQHRIVAKVDELMALCDRLEAARAEREATRDRLAAASLARLNAPDPDTFHDDARFALDALPALTTRPDQIKQLRQTILNLAVRGKLVPQDPNDEPASELLKRIANAQRRKLKRTTQRRRPVASSKWTAEQCGPEGLEWRCRWDGPWATFSQCRSRSTAEHRPRLMQVQAFALFERRTSDGKTEPSPIRSTSNRKTYEIWSADASPNG